MAFGALVIGDEILVGKRQDKHLSFIIQALAQRGLRLAWCEYHGDDPERLTAALKRTFASGDVVFSFGGIGATPDDHTRQCAAAALGVGLALHPEAEREIRGRFAGETTPQRLKMGEFPVGAEIIPNPFNRIPGFVVREHWFVPGFPQMAWPMLEWVLDTEVSPPLRPRPLGRSLGDRLPARVHHRAADGRDQCEVQGFEGLQPAQHGRGRHARRHIELGVRGAPCGSRARDGGPTRRRIDALNKKAPR